MVEHVAVITYGQDAVIGPDGRVAPVLSVSSCAVVDAVAAYWHQQQAAGRQVQLVLAAEVPFAGYPGSGELCKARLCDATRSVPAAAVTVITGIFNWTAPQVEALAAYAQAAGLAPGELKLVCLRYHQPRVQLHAEAFPILRGADYLLAEDLLATAADHSYDDRLSLLCQLARQEAIICWLCRLSPGDRRGHGLLGWVLNRPGRGCRVVDFLPQPGGGWKLKLWSSTERQLASLQRDRQR